MRGPATVACSSWCTEWGCFARSSLQFSPLPMVPGLRHVSYVSRFTDRWFDFCICCPWLYSHVGSLGEYLAASSDCCAPAIVVAVADVVFKAQMSMLLICLRRKKNNARKNAPREDAIPAGSQPGYRPSGVGSLSSMGVLETSDASKQTAGTVPHECLMLALISFLKQHVLPLLSGRAVPAVPLHKCVLFRQYYALLGLLIIVSEIPYLHFSRACVRLFHVLPVV